MVFSVSQQEGGDGLGGARTTVRQGQVVATFQRCVAVFGRTFENHNSQNIIPPTLKHSTFNLCGQVFVCGPYPHWLFMTGKGALRVHPMGIDGFVTCFAPFHNINCPKGFLYFNRRVCKSFHKQSSSCSGECYNDVCYTCQGEMRICVLPTHVSYDAPWPVRKVPLRCTPHCLAYHVDSKVLVPSHFNHSQCVVTSQIIFVLQTYSVVTSYSIENHQVVELIEDSEKEIRTVERDETFIWPTLEQYVIQLFSPVSWEPIPKTK